MEKNKQMNQIKTVVSNKNVKTGYVFVSTNDTYSGLETMVFECNADGEVTNWMDLDCNRYSSVEEAEQGHKMMVANWSKLSVFI